MAAATTLWDNDRHGLSPSPLPSRGGRVKTRLRILYGGHSAEHEVSCVSALNVIRTVDRQRYELRVVGITTSGAWCDTTAAALDAAASDVEALPSPDVLWEANRSVVPLSSSSKRAVLDFSLAEQGTDFMTEWQAEGAASSTQSESPEAPTVVLPLLHGPMGEDGTVQGLLELAGVAYCGSGVAGSAAAMDKGLAKSLLKAAGLPQARYIYLREQQTGDSTPGEVEATLGWPVFVKPANMGSSIGISKVMGGDALQTALTLALRYDNAVVIEEAISGRELEIGVLGWPELRTSVPGEIRPTGEFYDYDDKYVSGTAGLDVPADVGGDVCAEMSRLAIEACQALRVDSMARVDFLYEADGRGLLINEVNCIPGFTPISMFPRVWAASGVPYAVLVDELVEIALRRHDRRARFETGR